MNMQSLACYLKIPLIVLIHFGIMSVLQATNPCGEIPLPPYGACDLGAINLTQFVQQPFTDKASMNWVGIEEIAHIATRFLDNVINVSNYPLKKQAQQAFNTRRLGLGITGLADVFVMLGMRYGSQESIALSREIMRRIADVTWHTSVQLAREKGRFPAYKKAYLQGEFVMQLDDALRRDIARYGIRNSHHNTIAPTGTISLLANNVSNGIEPIFSAEYDRHVRDASGETRTFRVEDYAHSFYKQWSGKEDLPHAWVDTQALEPKAHLGVQAAIQPFIDNAISKTINIPVNFPFEKLVDVYTEAYQLGLKGCTVFRPNPVTGSVLDVPEEHCCQYEAS